MQQLDYKSYKKLSCRKDHATVAWVSFGENTTGRWYYARRI